MDPSWDNEKNHHRNWDLLWSQHSSFSQFTRIASIRANSKVDEGDKITYVQPEQDIHMGVSKNRGTPQGIVYNGKPY